MQQQLQTFINTHILAHQPIVVAVSGGADSLALLHALTKIMASEHIIVAHLNHGLRGAEADRDADFVARTSADWNLRCVVERTDVPALIAQTGFSVEDAARRARYAFLTRVALSADAPFILTAHHADDQAETVLMNFLRGSGLAGLRGMQPVSRVPGHEQHPIQLGRPLLGVARHEIEFYCQMQRLTPVEDSSNSDTTYFRNRVRQQLLPSLEMYTRQIRTRLLQLSDLASADHELLVGLAADAWTRIERGRGDGWLQFSLDGWRDLPLGLRRRTLRHALRLLQADLSELSYTVIEQRRRVLETGGVGAQTTFPGGWLLTLGYQHATLAAADAVVPIDAPQLATQQTLTTTDCASLQNGWELCAKHISADFAQITANRNPWQAFVSAEFAHSLHVRTREPGERFQPLGLGGRSTSLKEHMIDRKLPAALRNRWPLLATPHHLLWIPGHTIDERARVLPTATHCLHLTCHQI